MSDYDLPRHRTRAEEPWSTPNLAVNNQYPPTTNPYGSQSTVFDKSGTNLAGPSLSQRDLSRTPSPTPSEAKEMKTGAFDWEALRKWRFWIRREWLWYYVALVIICTLTALMTIYHAQIVDWLTPATKWMHDLKFGWLVPIGILFVISFPPLFGHEIVAVLCGLVWGLWIGFGIVAAGTFLGEVGNFYAFKYCCRARGDKMERTNISYACLARVVREGGFRIALIARLSAIPGHFTTAVFSTCGMGIITFSIAAILSLPKQFITVYLGVILEQSSNGTEDTKSKIISDVVLAITFIITLAAMWYIYRKMNQTKPAVIYARRKARQAKLASSSPYASEMTLPAAPKPQYAFSGPHSAMGSMSPKITYAPSPSPAAYEYKPSNNYGYDSTDDVSASDHSDAPLSPKPHGITSTNQTRPFPTSHSEPGYGPGPSRMQVSPSYGSPRMNASPNPYTPHTPTRANTGASFNPYDLHDSPVGPGASSAQPPLPSNSMYNPQSTPPSTYNVPPSGSQYNPPQMASGYSTPTSGYNTPGYNTPPVGYATPPSTSQAFAIPPPNSHPQQPAMHNPAAAPNHPQSPVTPMYNPYERAGETEPLTPRAQTFEAQQQQQQRLQNPHSQGFHAAEPTGMSYHTAVGSEDGRSFSPPPPSYMTQAAPR